MINKIIKSLDINKVVIASTLSGLKEEEYNWKVSDNSWSIKEIICHLHDEETEDFRARIEHILFKPNERMPPIFPDKWPEERNYQNENYEWKLKSFIIERDLSIDELEDWVNENWNNSYQHEEFGEISAKMMLHNWLAHDYLHIRQINKIRYLYLKSLEHNLNLKYAGNW